MRILLESMQILLIMYSSNHSFLTNILLDALAAVLYDGIIKRL